MEPGMTLILGVGNIIMGDEGFGVHVAWKLRETELPPDVKVEEGGVGGFNLLGSLEGVRRVIVVDVIMAGIEPGEVRLFRSGPALRELGKNIVSFHQVGALELVRMWGLLGGEPEVFFMVTRPVRLDWGTELTPEVNTAVTRAVELLGEICRDGFAALERRVSPCTL